MRPLMYGEPYRQNTLDSVTLIRYMPGTLKSCESGGARRSWALCGRVERPGGGAMRGRIAASSGRGAWGCAMAGATEQDAGGAAAKRSWGPGKLTKTVRERFLNHLAATAHVRDSADVAGVSVQALYLRRGRDPAFAAEWRAALLTGYDRIEAALIRRALGDRRADPLPGETADDADDALDVSTAMILLDRYRSTVVQATKAATRPTFRAPRAAAEATLLAKLKAYARLGGGERA